MARPMTTMEVHAFLDGHEGWVTLTTHGADGYPHSVPLGFHRDGDDLFMTGRAGTQKIRNIERNPRVSLVVDDGRAMQELRGVLIRGDAEVIADPTRVAELWRDFALRRGLDEELPPDAASGRIFIRVRPRRVTSWDYAAPDEG